MLISKSMLTIATCAGAVAAGALAVLHWPRREVPRSTSATAASAAGRTAATADQPPLPPSTPAPPRYATLEAPARFPTATGRGVDIIPGNAVERTSPPPLITVLHAMCISPEENCAFLRPLADGRGMLVCPTGNSSCGDGSATWDGEAAVRAAYVRDSVASAEHLLGEDTDPRRGDVLFGSSRGAFVARDVIYDGLPGRWTGLVLVGAAIAVDPEKMRRAGIHRVLLAAPDFDGAAKAMRRSQATLCRAGIPARFVSLGPHPHGMIQDSPRILAESMDWVMGRVDTAECREAAGR